MKIKAWWACYETFNFGDQLTPYIIKRLTGIYPEHTQAGKHYLLSGSILQEATNDSVVLGAGFGARTQRCNANPQLKIVRGYLTGKMLNEQGFDTTWIYGDPGVVLPLLFQPNTNQLFEHGILPHYVDYELFAGYNKTGVLVIDITQRVERVIAQMTMCKTIETSSLHGLIVAHAYGIPVQLKKYSDNIVGDGMKYEDYQVTPTNPKLILQTIKTAIGVQL